MFKQLDSIRDLTSGLRGLHSHWQGAHVRDRAPSLTRFGLQRVAAALDKVVVTEILRGPDGRPEDFAFLYIGRSVNGALRHEQTGQRLSCHSHKGPGTQIWQAYMAIAQECKPLLVTLPYVGPDPKHCCTVELFLPLLGDAGEPRFVLVGIEFMQAGLHACMTPPQPERAS